MKKEEKNDLLIHIVTLKKVHAFV